LVQEECCCCGRDVCHCHAQKNIDKIQSNLAELAARREHEQGKFKAFGEDLHEAEAR
jgi:hypothetical protein